MISLLCKALAPEKARHKGVRQTNDKLLFGQVDTAGVSHGPRNENSTTHLTLV